MHHLTVFSAGDVFAIANFSVSTWQSYMAVWAAAKQLRTNGAVGKWRSIMEIPPDESLFEGDRNICGLDTFISTNNECFNITNVTETVSTSIRYHKFLLHSMIFFE